MHTHLEEPLYLHACHRFLQVRNVILEQTNSTSRVNAQLSTTVATKSAISAFHGLTGAPFNFRAHPIAPAGTAILIHEAPEKRGTWAAHGVAGYYLGPALTHYRSHHVIVTATSSPRVTDTIAWFPETDVTPPPPNATEMLIAAIKDFSCALKQFNLTGNFVPPTLVQDLDALTSLHTGPAPPCTFPMHPPCTFPMHDVISSPLAPVSLPEPRVVQPEVHNPSIPEIRVVDTPTAFAPDPRLEPRVVHPVVPRPSVQELRVVKPLHAVQEPTVVFPTLATANPVHTAPLAPLTIVALTSPPSQNSVLGIFSFCDIRDIMLDIEKYEFLVLGIKYLIILEIISLIP
jgi:hypothetical protein